LKGSDKAIRDADPELEHCIAQYHQAMKNPEIKRIATVLSMSMIAIGFSGHAWRLHDSLGSKAGMATLDFSRDL
jgi:hypothetical protein